MIPSFEAIRAINRHRGDCLVISTCTPTLYWQAVSERDQLDVALPGTMGKASSLALGLALAQPDKKVWVLDGDGSILMNLGSLVTIAAKAAANLVHFVFRDDEYYGTGGQPVPGAGLLDLAAMAKAAGYSSTYEFDDLEDFVGRLPDLLDQQGPILVCLNVDHPEEVPSRVRVPRETVLAAAESMRAK